MKVYIALIFLVILSNCTSSLNSDTNKYIGSKKEVLTSTYLDSLRFSKIIDFVNDSNIRNFKSFSYYNLVILEMSKCNVCGISTLLRMDEYLKEKQQVIFVVFGNPTKETISLKKKYNSTVLYIDELKAKEMNLSLLDNFFVFVENNVPISWRVIE